MPLMKSMMSILLLILVATMIIVVVVAVVAVIVGLLTVVNFDNGDAFRLLHFVNNSKNVFLKARKCKA